MHYYISIRRLDMSSKDKRLKRAAQVLGIVLAVLQIISTILEIIFKLAG